MASRKINVRALLQSSQDADKIILPHYERHLMLRQQHYSPEIGEIIKVLLTTPARDRSASFSASAAGSCHRRQVLSFLGVPVYGVISPQLAAIFDNGTWSHMRTQAALLQAQILNRIEVPLFWRKMRTRGTVDGTGFVKDDHPRYQWRGLEFGLEFKTVNEWVYNQLVKKDQQKFEHKQQVHRYFLLSGWSLFVILYENKNTQAMHEWVVEPDPQLLGEQREELRVLNEAVDTKTLPPVLPSCKARMGSEFENCPYGGGIDSPCLKAGKWVRINGKEADPQAKQVQPSDHKQSKAATSKRRALTRVRSR